MHSNQPLSETTERARVTITAIAADKATQRRLMGLGIGIGKNIELLHNRHGDVVLSNGNSRITLGQEVASQILGCRQENE